MHLVSVLFAAATAAAVGTQFLDWNNTRKLIAQKGLSGEKNPLMRGIFGIKKVGTALAFAYKMAPVAAMALSAHHFHDFKFWEVAYVNGPGVDRWAIGWILGQLGVMGWGLVGYLMSEKAK